VELIKMITSQLGVTEEQAKGGAGLLLSLAKGKLGEQDFAKIAKTVPGADDLLSQIPSGGIGGMLGGLAKKVTGGGGLADLASLAGGFKKLGLESDMVGKFVPIVVSFVQSRGGDAVKGLLEKALK